MKDDPEAQLAIERVIDALQSDFSPYHWLRAAIAIGGTALGHMSRQEREFMAPAFHQAVTRLANVFEDDIQNNAFKKKLN
jgi:hypothetical protein